MSEYRLSLSQVFRLPVPVGSELLEARINRLHPDLGRNSYMDRAIVAARNACRRDLLSRFRLVNNVNPVNTVPTESEQQA